MSIDTAFRGTRALLEVHIAPGLAQAVTAVANRMSCNGVPGAVGPRAFAHRSLTGRHEAGTVPPSGCGEHSPAARLSLWLSWATPPLNSAQSFEDLVAARAVGRGVPGQTPKWVPLYP